VKFGLFHVLGCPDDGFPRAHREVLAQIGYAEHLGSGEVWPAEHHGSDYDSIPSPEVAAAAIAERTTRMRIGIAVSNLTWPMRAAEGSVSETPEEGEPRWPTWRSRETGAYMSSTIAEAGAQSCWCTAGV
jgi:hypothetical protein